VPGHNRSQRLKVTANSALVGSFELEGEAQLVCSIPRHCIGGRDALEIRFQQPDCIQPAASGGTDTRELAILFKEVRLSPA